MSTMARFAAGAATATLLLAVVPPAIGKDGDVVRTGRCSGSAVWKVKVGARDGKLEVEGQVDSNRVGQRWTWRIKHNGVLVDSGVRRTGAPSGSFTVRRTVANAAGTDTVVFRARRPATGQTCRGVVTF